MSAALLLGRCLRKVVVFDSGEHRNKRSPHINGLLTRDGIKPSMYLSLAREELEKYGVQILQKKVVEALCGEKGIEVKDGDGTAYYAKKLLIATGIQDRVPNIPGFREFYGKSIFHCPYCDGYEVKGLALGAYGKGKNAIGMALALKNWSNNVSLFTDGRGVLEEMVKVNLSANGIQIYTGKIREVTGQNEKLEKVIFQDGSSMCCEAIFFSNGYTQSSELARMLKCDFTAKGVVRTNKKQETNIMGVYVAGDAAKDMQMVSVATAEGTKAGVAINTALQVEQWK